VAEPPLRDLTFWCRNDVTVDSGAGIDVRRLDDANSGAGDSSQTAVGTHTSDNQGRTWDPATAGVSTPTDPLALQRLGWALPLADITPADTRCKARLPAGNATLAAPVTMTRANAAPLTACTNFTLQASLWRYKPSTDAGVFIASAVSAGQTYDLVLQPSATFNLSLTLTWAADVVFERDEVLLLQIGCGTGNLGNPALGTTNYTFTLQIDAAGAGELTLNTASLNAKCDLTAAGALALNGSPPDVKTSRRRTLAAALSLAGAADQRLTLHRTRSAVLALNAAFDKQLELRRTHAAAVALNAQRPVRHVKPKAKQATLTLAAAEDYRLVLRRQRAATLALSGDITTTLRVRKIANLALNAVLDTRLQLQRRFTANVALNGRLYVVLAQHILARLAGGAVTVVRRIFAISD
jgi:hypothetical protein